jgi:NADH-quinone oxidoreductase subunit A
MEYWRCCRIFANNRIVLIMDQFFFLQTSGVNSAANYLPIGLQLAFCGMGLVATIMVLSNFLGPKRKTADKLQNFESGIEIRGNARQPMAIKYFLVAILVRACSMWR